MAAPTIANLKTGCVIAAAELDVLCEQARALDETAVTYAIERARDEVLAAWGRLGEPREGDAYYMHDREAQPG